MVKQIKKEEVKKTIAVLDGSVQTAISVSGILENAGFKTFQGYNLEDGENLANKEKIDLFLIDITLDGASGLDAAKILTKYKVIIISAGKIEDSKLKGLKNIVGFVSKPVDPEELVNVVKSKL